MRNPFRRLTSELAISFSQVRGNARAVVLMHAFWSLPFNLYSPYLTQYMLNLGCSKAEVGVVNAIGMATGGVIGLFAGWATDRLGRRRANLIADTASWALYCLILAFANNFAWFVAASVANSFVRLIAVSWNCTIAEGTPPDKRLNVYWWLNIINTLSALCTPLMGLFVGSGDPERLVLAMRWTLLISALAHAASFIARNRMHSESAVGSERMLASKTESPLAALKAYAPMFRMLAKNPALLLFISLRALYYVQMNVRGTFFSVTVVQGLGFDYGVIGLVNLVAGACMLPAQLVLLPKLSRAPRAAVIAAGLAVLLISNVSLALSPARDPWMLWGGIVVAAVGAIITGMMIDTETANAMPDGCRAQLLGLMSLIMVAASAVFMVLGGVLAEIPGIGPRLPIGLVAVMIIGCLGLTAFIKKPKAERKIATF